MTLPRTRNRSRRFDLVLWGATGFTGRLTAEYILREHGGEDVRIALAGRNRSKLEAIRDDLAQRLPHAAKLELLTADSHDRASLDALAADAEVICSTVGPYAKFGPDLVAACVDAGTDYCDLTGEPQFVRRMIDTHQAAAKQTGARIVHCCGFDSIPSDLGTWTLVEEASKRFGVTVNEVKLITGRMRGGVSGGTIASMMGVIDEVRADRSILRKIGNPYALNPQGERRGPDQGDQKGIRFDEDLPGWTGPFLMASINTRVVRRTNALLGYRYGRDFRYSECSGTGSGLKGWSRAAALAGGFAGGMLGASFGPTRKLLMTKLPAPGEGPSQAERDAGGFTLHLIGKGQDADGKSVTVRAKVVGLSDPGYGETAKMLGESALCLALDGGELEAEGGIGTPASVMGGTLVERLRSQGMQFEVGGPQ